MKDGMDFTDSGESYIFPCCERSQRFVRSESRGMTYSVREILQYGFYGAIVQELDLSASIEEQMHSQTTLALVIMCCAEYDRMDPYRG